MSRVKMPHNNRVSSSSALKTNDMWSKTIGFDPYGPGKAEESSSTSDQTKNLMLLARMSNLSGSENRGGCKKCGMLGHLTFQCRNTIQMPSSSAQDDSSSDDSSDDNEEADTKKDRSRVEPIAPSSPDKKKRKYEDEDEDDSDSRDGELDHRESKSHKKSEKSSKHKHKHKHKHDKKEKKSKHKKEKKSSSD